MSAPFSFYDGAVSVVLIINLLYGARRGINDLGSLLAWIAVALVAPPVASSLHASSTAFQVGAVGAVSVGLYFSIRFLTKIILFAVSFTPVKLLSIPIGVASGLLRGALLCALTLVVTLAVSPQSSLPQKLQQSNLGPYILHTYHALTQIHPDVKIDPPSNQKPPA